MVDCFPVASWLFCPVVSRPRLHILSYGPLSLASSAASVSSNATLRLSSADSGWDGVPALVSLKMLKDAGVICLILLAFGIS
ncbi:hypothetical protein Nepgr_017392 [Nepenthes gracilis]|uniref:Uncharacterized protein n=1 Tax=Nepenthes gracilis TaxID=150966 RepID=A0AAD3SRX9_NEPGR|nr:hypothetical protein Nepgr_017392 [Nepenthes gracilis]